MPIETIPQPTPIKPEATKNCVQCGTAPISAGYSSAHCGFFCQPCIEDHATECEACAHEFELFQNPSEETLV